MADIIDIDVFQTVTSVSFAVEPNTNIININKVTSSAVGGATNLSTTQTATDFTINSDNGDDALVPLGNGALAGATLNDYTTTEKSKLNGIASGAEVNVNADWNATSGDAQILNKPTIPSIAGLATVTYVDTQDALKVDKVTGSRLITSSESTILGNTSGTNTGDNATNSQYSGLAASKQNNITLTTTGSSGAATLVGATLNIPQYSGDSGVTSVTAISPITSSGGSTPVISTSMAANKLIGRSTTGTGVMEEITVGSGLTLSGGTLTNTATATPLGYYGAFQDNTIQTATAINTPYAMKFGITDLSNSVTIVSDGSNLTRITIANTGIYNIQFSTQFDRTNSGTDVVDIWLRKNGVDVVGTGGKIVLSGGAVASALIATWNYVLDIVAGDYYQIMWSTPDTHVRLLYEAAQTSPFVHPLIPSTILTVTQQSGIMAGTGITGLGVSGSAQTGATQTLEVGTTGTDFYITSSGNTQTFNLPIASSVNTGKLSATDWSTFNGKANVDSQTFTGTPTLPTGTIATTQTALDSSTKLATTAFVTAANNLKVDKSMGAYSIRVNNTASTANGVETTYRAPSQQTYVGTPTWTATTVPSGTTTHTYNWIQIGNMVTLKITLLYSVAGLSVTSIIVPLPSDAPTPLKPSGLTAASNYLYVANGFPLSVLTSAPASGSRIYMRSNSANNGFEIPATLPSGSHIGFDCTIQYFTS